MVISMKNSKNDKNELIMTDSLETEVKKDKKFKWTKGKKIACSVSAVIVVIALLLVNYMAIYTNIVYILMPKSLEPVIDGKTVTFYVYKNRDFNQFKDRDTPLKAFCYYYYDENGDRVDLDYDGVYKSGDESFSPSVWFMLSTQSNLSTVKEKFNSALPFIIIALIIVVILLWFRSWSKREDAKKEAIYGPKKSKSKANKKSKK